MKIVHLKLPHVSYPIYIGIDILKNSPNILLNHIHGKQVLIVTQSQIAQWHLESIQQCLQGYQSHVVYIPEGEQYKNIDEWQKIINTLLQNHCDRSVTLIALGGGVIGDLTGFAAACYLRGVPFIQIPTSLMAQVDAALGGKTGINHALGKNMLGAFHQPQCVISDMAMLNTLPMREYISGLAEVVKYGLIRDAEFFCWIENNIELISNKNVTALEYLLERSAAIKCEIVEQDERDAGVRNLLNFGHTFGHAFEAMYAFQGILHGEAVASGMLMAAQLSVSRGWLSESDYERIFKVLSLLGLLQHAPKLLDKALFVEYMKRDKKVTEGQMTFILLKNIGEAITVKSGPGLGGI